MKNLNKLAIELYEARKLDPRLWVAVFGREELIKLWDKYCTITEKNPFGAEYDDEVYEALNIMGYWK